MSRPYSTMYVRAFEKNCPNVRLTGDEREELNRLFHECIKHTRQDTIEIERAKTEQTVLDAG